jgi:hypothetical protein
MKQSSKECVMRAKFYSVLLSLGLAATTLAKAGFADAPAAPSPNTERVIDAGPPEAELLFSLPGVGTSGRDIGPHELTDLSLVLSSPGLLFGLPAEYFHFSLHSGAGATTGVVFPGLLK